MILRPKIVKLRLFDQWFYFKRNLPGRINKWMLFLGFLGLLLALYDFGFHRVVEWQHFVNRAYGVFFLLLSGLQAIRLVFHYPKRVSAPLLVSEIAMLCLCLIALTLHWVYPLTSPNLDDWSENYEFRIFYNLLLLLNFIIEFSRTSLGFMRIRFNPPLLFAGSFFFLIILGAGLLMLPRATYDGISFIDSLFTATSAVCVTGLIVVDTATHFTRFGQVIILLLIQLGGLGVLVFTSLFGFFFQGSHSFQNQIFLKDFINEERLGEIFKTLAKIVAFTLIIEFIGAVFIFKTLPAHFSHMERAWYAVFHSVSAYCNAGFSVFTYGLYDASAGVRYQYNLHLVIALLIIVGGIGFPVLLNFYSFVKHVAKNLWNRITKGDIYHHTPWVISASTRLVLVSTVILLVAGTFSFWLFERNGILEGMTAYGKSVTSFFAAVTPRTAGFNTFDLTALALPTIILYLGLMWIGASPHSTGGGIKTSTFALAFLNVISMAKGKNRVEFFGREITSESIGRAFAIVIMSVVVIGVCIGGIAYTNPGLPFTAIVFESISAFSTVGLSLGITHQLDETGKLFLIATMFIGRIGTLTILVAFFRKLSSWNYRYPSEQIFIN
ncbi:MAG TPA: potassium transporter TrkG [Bacteroidales bacterium]|nr:potassium transporter TrkG [Bacteroidales bacterium]